jgi:hypothetical protein
MKPGNPRPPDGPVLPQSIKSAGVIARLRGSPDWRAIGLLLLVLTAAYYNIIFLGQTLVASSNYHPFDYRWDVIKVGKTTGGAFVNWHDLGGTWWQWEPAGSFFSEQFRHGRIPLWDPTVAGGVDTHVGLVQGQYYPPYALMLLLGNTPIERDVYYLLQLLAAALFCYFFLRRNGLAPIAAACAGSCYMLSGSMTQNVNGILGQAFAVLPVMLWSIDRLLAKPSWRGTGITGLILSVCVLSSFLPAVISGYLLVGLYVVVSVIFMGRNGPLPGFDWRTALRTTGFAAAAVVLSILIAAFLLVPVQVASMADVSFAHWYDGVGLFSYNLDQLLTLISPSISFDMWQTSDPSGLLFTPKYGASFFYVGLIPILLAALARPGRDPGRRKLWVFCFSGTLVLLLKLLGVPPVQWLGYLPVFDKLHFTPYFCGALTLCIAGLAGLGVETVIRRRNLAAVGAVALGLLIVFAGIVRFGLTEPLNPTLAGPTLWNSVARFGMEGFRIAIMGLGLLVIVWLRATGMKARATGILLFVLIGVDLVPLADHSRFLRSDVWKNVPNYVRYFHSDPSAFRVHGVHDLALTPNVGEGVGIATISSRVSFNSNRFSEIIHRYFTTPDLPYPLTRSLLPTSRNVLDVLNVKYLLLFSPTPAVLDQMHAAGLTDASADGEFKILQNPTVFARAYVARAVSVAASPDQSLAAIASLSPGQVVLDETPAGKGTNGEVQSLRDDLDSITIRARSDSPGILVFEENAAPGWRATVNGSPAPILIANHTFQAVEIPAGSSEVRFRYRTPGLIAGILISLVGLFTALGFILLRFTRGTQ